MKILFQKMCTIAVILYLFFPFLTQTWEKMISFYKEIVKSFSVIVADNILYSITLGLVAIVLILWVLHDEDSQEEEIEKEKKRISK